MLRKRQQVPEDDPRLLVRSYAVTHPVDVGLSTRAYAEWDQLAYATRGVMTVTTAHGTWVVPPHRAVWIPAGVPHGVRMSGRVSLRTLFFRAGRFRRKLPRACVAVNVPPLLRELVVHAARASTLRADVPSEKRLADVILDQLEALDAEPLQLPMPRDARARALAERLAKDPSLPVSRALRAVGASRRTLERVFARETQMTLGRFVQRLRLVEALRLLASGRAVTAVALDVGYASPSAFVAAFRRVLGTTPGRYFG